MTDLTKQFVDLTLLKGKRQRIDLDDVYSITKQSINNTVIEFKNPVFGDGRESYKEPFEVISKAHNEWLKEKSKTNDSTTD